MRGTPINVLLLGVSLLACVLVLEIFFRVVIPASQIPIRYFDADEKILRFDTEGPREGLFTRGRFAEVRARWRINNWGWNSEIDYAPRAERPPDERLIAIIGDSFVNSFQVDPPQNLAAVLRETLGGRFQVYGFGMPGAPLSQYLQMSRYVDRRFDPEVLVFVVVHNDFFESIRELDPNPSFLQVSHANGVWREVEPSAPTSPGPPLWMKSATLRYLKITLQSYLLAGAAPPWAAGRFIANIPVDEVSAARDLIREATLLLVGRIRAENADRDVIFVMDAPRTDLYAGTPGGSAVGWLNELLAEACRANDVPLVDLTQRFTEVHARDGTRFETAIDAHWNEAGHREAALALATKLRELGIWQGRSSAAPDPISARAP